MDREEKHPLFPSPETPDGGFRVPEGYFDKLPGSILERVKKEEHPIPKSTPLLPRWTYFAAAAVVVFALLIGGLLQRERTRDYFATGADIQEVYPSVFSEISEEEILEITGEELFASPANLQGIDNEIIIDYLLTEGVDEYLIAEKL